MQPIKEAKKNQIKKESSAFFDGLQGAFAFAKTPFHPSYLSIKQGIFMPNNAKLNAKLTAIQMVSTPVVSENLRVAADFIARAANEGAKLILLPEYFAAMVKNDEERSKIAEPFGQGIIQDFLQTTAVKHSIWLIGGSLPIKAEEQSEPKIYNASLAFSPEGKCVARYDKIHLFSYQSARETYNESAHALAGKTPVSFATPFGKIGLSICYDLRFPELFRAFSKENPLDLILMPAAFTHATGKDHWEILLRARAIENQCYVLAAAQGGFHDNGRETWGQSALIDPWGVILAERKKGQALVMGEMAHEKINEVRQKIPALNHRVL